MFIKIDKINYNEYERMKLVGSGVEAKIVILDGKVKVNGQVELQRGKKLYDKDVVSFAGETIEIVKE